MQRKRTWSGPPSFSRCKAEVRRSSSAPCLEQPLWPLHTQATTTSSGGTEPGRRSPSSTGSYTVYAFDMNWRLEWDLPARAPPESSEQSLEPGEPHEALVPEAPAESVVQPWVRRESGVALVPVAPVQPESPDGPAGAPEQPEADSWRWQAALRRLGFGWQLDAALRSWAEMRRLRQLSFRSDCASRFGCLQ